MQLRLRCESGARDEAEFQAMLRQASSYYVADAIQPPVLLIHGECEHYVRGNSAAEAVHFHDRKGMRN